MGKENQSPESVATCFLLGSLLSCFLMGIVYLQTATYFENYSKDRWTPKLTVGSLSIMNTMQTVCQIYYIHHILIDRTGSSEALVELPWYLAINFLHLAMTSAIVQTYFAYRLYHLLGRNRLLPAAVIIVTLLSTAASLGAFILQRRYRTYADEGISDIFWVAEAAQILAGCADTIIAGGMMYAYWSTTKHSTSASGALVIYRRIVTMSIQTNLLTCVVCMTAGIVCVLGYTAVAWLFLFCSPKLYHITLMSSLNARQQQRNKLSELNKMELSASISGDRSRNIRRVTLLTHESQTEVSIQHPDTKSEKIDREELANSEQAYCSDLPGVYMPR